MLHFKHVNLTVALQGKSKDLVHDWDWSSLGPNFHSNSFDFGDQTDWPAAPAVPGATPLAEPRNLIRIIWALIILLLLQSTEETEFTISAERNFLHESFTATLIMNTLEK